MEAKHKQSGITLMEMTVVVAAVALLAVLGLPAISAFVNSLVSSGPTKAMISATLSSARAIAAKEHRYAGVRFQEDLYGRQYIIFIIQDPKIGAYFFRAVEGLEPIKLPEAVGVMDLVINKSYEISSNDDIRMLEDVNDTTTFSIVFSPSGKLVIHNVRVRNRDGYVDSTANSDISNDDVFNKKAQVDAGVGMFYQDDYLGDWWSSYPDFGLGEEPSRNSFIIYERDKFRAAFENSRAWSDYLKNLDAIYINPYVGTIIEK